MSFTAKIKNISSFISGDKGIGSFRHYLRHGKGPLIPDLMDFTMGDTVYRDDGTTLVNVTLDKFSDAVWTSRNKN